MRATSRSCGRTVHLPALALLALAACGSEERGQEMSQSVMTAPPTITVAGVGFATPESVLHDPESDVYLVSNINGTPVAKDGNGFISRLSPDGTIVALRWIDGAAPGVTLHAPKGMALQGSTLYVADIDCVRMFDRTTGAPLGEACPNGATFLNDVGPAPDGVSVFFTDSGLDASFAPSGTDAVYRLSEGGRITVIARSPSLGAPNGVSVGTRGILVASFGSGEVYALDAEGRRTNVMPPSQGQYDGIVAMDDGGFLVSSWGEQAVIRVNGAGAVSHVVHGVEAPADIGFDRTRSRVLVPLFNANEVRIVPLG
jgi:sugar lactone lactonase YvrE